MTASPAPLSRLRRGYAIALTSAAILSTTAIFIRYLTNTYRLPALVLACWRDGFAAISLLLALALARPALLKVSRRHLPYLLFYGLMMAIFNALWTLSVTLNGAAVATVLAYSSAGFTALLGRWLLKESLDGAKLLAVTVSLGGCVLVAGAYAPSAWQTNLTGILTGVLAGLWYAIYTLLGRSAAQRGLNSWTTLLYIFPVATLCLLAFNLLPGGILPGAAARPADLLWLGNAWAGWGVLLLLAAGPTLAGFGLYNLSLTYLPSSVANLIATSEPVFTAVIAYLLLGERLTWIQMLGGALVLGGVLLLRVHEERLARRSAAPAPAEQGKEARGA
jgi:drug/metabolite transporter (DMT)-like permease